MHIGGLDIGTTGCKIAIYDSNVTLVKTFYDSYDVIHKNNCDEINFNDILVSVLKILSKASECFDIEAIAITSFGESFVMVDENDNILAPAMLYNDIRGKEEINELVNVLGANNIAKKTGVKAHEMYSLAKILWLKNNLKDKYDKAKKILLCQDYIIYMLTGIAQIDYSLAQRTQIFNIKEKKYDEDILKVSGIDVNLLSKPVKMGSFAGIIKKSIALKYNINPSMKVFNGCHDQIANMFGAGIFNNDIAMDGSGTIECLCAILDDIPDNQFFEDGYCCVPYIDNKYATYAFSYGGCCCINEFKNKYGKSIVDYCKNNNLDFYTHVEDHFTDKLTDILILPYFNGAGTPYMDLNVKGSLFNISFENSLYDIYQALLESIGFELKVNFDYLKKYGIEIKTIKACGGGANSLKWVQIKSDILNTKFKVLNCKEVGCAGTALIALKSMNLIDSIMDGYSKLNIEKYSIIPNETSNIKYQEKYKKYKKLYKLVKKL